jgi:hypothetical protein
MVDTVVNQQPGIAPMLPQVGAMYANDPRRALAQLLATQGQQALQGPAYEPWEGVVKGLTSALSTLPSTMLSSNYQDMNTQALSDLQSAQKASAGSPEVRDPNDPTKIIQPATPPDYNKLTQALLPSPVWGPVIATQQLSAAAKMNEPYSLKPQEQRFGPGGQVLASNTAPTTDIGKLMTARDALAPDSPNRAAYDAQIQKLNQEGGVAFTGTGASPVAGYGPAKADITSATSSADAWARLAPDLRKIDVQTNLENQFQPVTVTLPQPDGTMREVQTTRSALRSYIQGQNVNSLASALGGPGPGPTSPPNGLGARGPVPGPSAPPTAGGPPSASLPGIPGKQVMTPEQTEDSGALGKVSGEITASGQKAPVTLQRLDVIANAANGFRPGASGDARLASQRALVDAFQTIGMGSPDKLAQSVASGETIGKEGGYLASEMTRVLGSREAASVFNQIQGIMPNIKMSEGGFHVILNSLRQGAQRDQDIANFRDQWIGDPSHTGSIRGMQQAFDQQFPVESYASRVVPYPVPSKQEDLKPNVIYRGPNGLGLWDGRQFIGVK